MPGKACRELSREEVTRVFAAFHGKYKLRNQALFVFGCYTGLRIGELLNLRMGQVLEIHGTDNFDEETCEISLLKEITYKQTKTDRQRTVTLTNQPRRILFPWIKQLIEWELISKDCFLFCSKNGKRLKYKQILRIIHAAYENARVYGNVATHSMRKTFVARLLAIFNKYVRPGEERSVLMNLKELTGHESLESLGKYIPLPLKEINNALIEYGAEIII